ncbi:MAG: hypothetical protein R6V56_03630 [Lentisphaeria bacterium]
MSQNKPREQSFRLEGLLEVPVSDTAELKSPVEAWARKAHSEFGLNFHVQVEDRGLSIMPDDQIRDSAKLPVSVEESVRSALTALVELIPEQDRPHVMSTIRSLSYGRGKETQTVYAVKPDGSVDVESRTQAADTEKMPDPVSLRDQIKSAALAFSVAALLFAVSAFFIDYPGLFNKLLADIKPTDIEALEINPGPFAGLIEISKDLKKSKAGQLTLDIIPTPQLISALSKFKQAAPPENFTWEKRLAVETLAKGRLYIEFYDASNESIKYSPIHIPRYELASGAKINIILPRQRAETALLTY